MTDLRRVLIVVHAIYHDAGSAYRLADHTGGDVVYYMALNLDEAVARVDERLRFHRGDTPEMPTPTVEDLVEAVLRDENPDGS